MFVSKSNPDKAMGCKGVTRTSPGGSLGKGSKPDLYMTYVTHDATQGLGSKR